MYSCIQVYSQLTSLDTLANTFSQLTNRPPENRHDGRVVDFWFNKSHPQAKERTRIYKTGGRLESGPTEDMIMVP